MTSGLLHSFLSGRPSGKLWGSMSLRDAGGACACHVAAHLSHSNSCKEKKVSQTDKKRMSKDISLALAESSRTHVTLSGQERSSSDRLSASINGIPSITIKESNSFVSCPSLFVAAYLGSSRAVATHRASRA